MQCARTLERVERERERERATVLENKVVCISVALIFQEILNKINLRNKDPCVMGLVLRVECRGHALNHPFYKGYNQTQKTNKNIL